MLSHANVWSVVRCTEKPSSGLAFSMSMAASTTHMNPAWPAAVPAVCTMLFSQRVPRTRVISPITESAMKPKNALTTEMLGPYPILSTTYG